MSAATLLPLLAFSTFGPTLVVVAVKGDAPIPLWARWMIGVTGAVAIGAGLSAMVNPSAR